MLPPLNSEATGQECV